MPHPTADAVTEPDDRVRIRDPLRDQDLAADDPRERLGASTADWSLLEVVVWRRPVSSRSCSRVSLQAVPAVVVVCGHPGQR